MSMIKQQVSSFFLHIGKPRNGKSIMEAKGQIQVWYGTPSAWQPFLKGTATTQKILKAGQRVKGGNFG